MELTPKQILRKSQNARYRSSMPAHIKAVRAREKRDYMKRRYPDRRVRKGIKPMNIYLALVKRPEHFHSTVAKIYRNTWRTLFELSTNLNRVNKIVQATRDQFRKHIESQFTPGMSWDNYGKRGGVWECDHIKPLSEFTFDNPEEIFIAAHFSNVRPLLVDQNRIQRSKKISATA